MSSTLPPKGTELLSLVLESDWNLVVRLSAWFVLGLLLLVLMVFLAKAWPWWGGWRSYEIDEAEIGVGSGKVKLRPNVTDRQIAYAIWVELSTRKIGLPIDLEHDVIAEIYDSWYSFFGVTRELIKSVPIQKARGSSTQKIIALSIEVLNEGLRPHLTRWQARFRRWYERELERKNDVDAADPQEIQRKFPKFAELKADMERVNERLIRYRGEMHRLAMFG